MNRKLYRKIAKKHGVSVKDVKKDLKEAVNTVDPNIVAFEGTLTTDNVVAYVIDRTNKNHASCQN